MMPVTPPSMSLDHRRRWLTALFAGCGSMARRSWSRRRSAWLKLLRMVSPGMFQRPAAIVVICIDRAKAESFGMRPNAKGLYVDVGTAAQTMLLAAHSLGLGAGVVTSFSQAAVSAVLNVPEGLSPEMFVCLGHAAATQPRGMPSRGPVTWQTLTQWERFP